MSGPCDENCPVCWPEGDPHACVFIQSADDINICYQCGEHRSTHTVKHYELPGMEEGQSK